MVSLVKNVVHWGSSQRTKTPVPVDLCEICGKKPKFVENGHKHPYCSRSCARNGTGPSPTVCALQGCRATGKPAFANFCSEAHAREGVRLGQVDKCELCETQPRTVGTMCIPCDRVVRIEPQLRELSSDSKTFRNLRAQFLSEWESPGVSPSFEKAYEIILPRDIRLRHEQYRRQIPRLTRFEASIVPSAFATWGRKSQPYVTLSPVVFAASSNRALNRSLLGPTIIVEVAIRLGEGIYSYRNPALADRFATSCTSSPYRVVIACDIAVEPTDVDVDETTDEESLFVPTVDGILPMHIIIYATSK
ncbi:hypothetical protein CVT25_007278 [Psilocybe cyanescens]|uniref:Uncharacterized protein n=1 Tax=Psilocybe cyanescens TaxID=93625 RepID=A0A409XPG3_PSICY|nr:hypothetical protein CVT25_007278 [Psilocybe cyanescens]